MVFSSLTFLYIFLPLVIFLNFILQKKFRNALLLVASILFYSWGGVSYTSLLIISIVFNFVIGKLISNNLGNPKSRLYLTLGVIINLGFLGVFKYGNFIVQNINVLFENTGISFSISNPGILLPIGISFFTFQGISLVVDVYKENHFKNDKIISHSLYEYGKNILFFII